jgi:hypothetical protein
MYTYTCCREEAGRAAGGRALQVPRRQGGAGARLISQATAMAGTGLIELRRIEAAKEIATELARSPNVTHSCWGKWKYAAWSQCCRSCPVIHPLCYLDTCVLMIGDCNVEG